RGKAGQVDAGGEVLVEPLLPPAEAQEGAQGNETAPARGGSQALTAGARRPGATGDGPLEGTQQVAVEGAHLQGAGALAEGLEAAQFAAVGGDRGQAGVAVQLQPLQELGDRLGERDGGGGRLGHPAILRPNCAKLQFSSVRLAALPDTN